MKSPHTYIDFDCEQCISCDACIPTCICNLILYSLDFTCLMVDKEACMDCYCSAPCYDVCPAEAIIIKYDKPTTAGSK